MSPSTFKINYSWRSAILSSELPPLTRHILLTISCFMGDSSSCPIPELEELIESTGLSGDKLLRGLRSAESKEWLVQLDGEYTSTVPEWWRTQKEFKKEKRKKCYKKKKEKLYKKKNIPKEKVSCGKKPSGPSTQDRELKFLPIAKSLSTLICSHRDTRYTPGQLKKWAKEFRVLSECDQISIRRIKLALRGYRKIYGLEYVPVIDSGKAFRKKFLNLEDAIKRELEPKRKGSGKIGAKRTKSFEETHKPDLVID